MSFTKILEYILFIALILLTLFNFYILTVGRKKKQRGEADFRKILATLENKTFEEMKRNHLDFGEKHGYINDSGQGIFLAFDQKKKMLGITILEEFYLIPYDEVLSCEVKNDTLPKDKITNIRVELETKDSRISFAFGKKVWKEKSHLGTFLLSDAKEFCAFVTSHCIPGQKG